MEKEKNKRNTLDFESLSKAYSGASIFIDKMLNASKECQQKDYTVTGCILRPISYASIEEDITPACSVAKPVYSLVWRNEDANITAQVAVVPAAVNVVTVSYIDYERPQIPPLSFDLYIDAVPVPNSVLKRLLGVIKDAATCNMVFYNNGAGDPINPILGMMRENHAATNIKNMLRTALLKIMMFRASNEPENIQLKVTFNMHDMDEFVDLVAAQVARGEIPMTTQYLKNASFLTGEDEEGEYIYDPGEY